MDSLGVFADDDFRDVAAWYVRPGHREPSHKRNETFSLMIVLDKQILV